jgi:class 3 adenylate cyclase
MPPLRSRERAQLPDSAFAYVDSRGRRRLPIHDEAHVRNALSRFDQVAFEDDAARDRARTRLLRAAKRHGIVPIGFVNAQLEPQRKLPRGLVTLLMTDIEGSTELLQRLDDRYPKVLADVRRILRAAVRRSGGRVAEARADELFAVYEDAAAALGGAVAAQRSMQGHEWPDQADVRVRIGLHRGRPTFTDAGYVGLAIHTAARICSAAHGGQVVVSPSVRAAVGASLPAGVGLASLGTWKLHGIAEPVELFQVEAEGLHDEFPPLRRVSLA